ncbi:MAG TPA: flagellar export chaperone FlgN [Phycisphaerae bacterium]|nr:flagellar export chaperone FlgN [Phycisphaerae bacterium]
MTNSNVDNLARDLVRLLSDMTGTYGELAMHMHDKLDAIRRADADRITSITARETTLADRLMERHGLRRQMMRQLQQALGLGADAMRLTDLAEHLPEPRRSQMITVAEGLKKQLASMEQLRQTSELVSREMLTHLGEVLTVMTSGVQGGDTYGRTGVRQSTSMARVFEAVG